MAKYFSCKDISITYVIMLKLLRKRNENQTQVKV